MCCRYVWQRSFESGGLMWNFISRRLIGCLAVFVVFTAVMLIVLGGYAQGILLLITLCPLLVKFDG